MANSNPIPKTVYKQLKALAATLPEMKVRPRIQHPPVPVRFINGKWREKATNHERQIIAAYRENGRPGVEAYVQSIKEEFERFKKDFFSRSKNAENE